MRTTTRCTLSALAALSAIACHGKQKEAEPVVPVQLSPAIRGSIRNIITADAILYPRDQANIVPKISAPVRRYLVQRGDHVKANQLLAELENRDLAAAAAASRGQYTQAESNLRTTEASTVPEAVTKAQTDLDAARQSLDAAQKVLESRQELFRQGAIARKLVDEAQVSYAQAKGQFETAQQHRNALQSVGSQEQIRSAQGQVAAAKGQYDAAQAQVAYSEIRSPVNGVVTDRPLWPGEMATTDKPVLTVMDISSVVARINMSQDQARDIQVGDDATLTAEGSEPIPAKVTVVSPAVDANSTTVQVWVQAPNPGERLRAGMSVHAAIVAATIDGATLIPAAAVLGSNEGGSKVMVVDDKDTAHERKIEIGVKEEDLVQVVAGVQPGERVVTVGGLGLEDKAKVRVLKPGERRPGEEEEKDEDKGEPK